MADPWDSWQHLRETRMEKTPMKKGQFTLPTSLSPPRRLLRRFPRNGIVLLLTLLVCVFGCIIAFLVRTKPLHGSSLCGTASLI